MISIFGLFSGAKKQSGGFTPILKDGSKLSARKVLSSICAFFIKLNKMNLNQKFKSTLPSFGTGFTLIEMMVVVAIFLVITGVILLNTPQVREKLSIELVAQEISINIRGTQVYGVATQARVDENNQVQFPSYGIYFAPLSDVAFVNKPRVFGFSDPTSLEFNIDGVAETYEVPAGYKIAGLKYDTGNGVWQTADNLVIGFIRPSPTARFLINEDVSITGVQRVGIVIESVRERKTKQISVYSNGQIAVIDPD